jgi:hypothetical protein
MNWRVVVVAVVAFAVGIGAGGLAEHQRLKSDSNKKTSTTKTTPTTNAKAADWFGTHAQQACPTLKKLGVSGAASYKAIFSSAPWPSRQSTLATEAAAAAADYRALVPLADQRGQTELAFLASYQDRIKTAVSKSATLPAYLTAQKALNSSRLKTANAVISRTTKRCSG